MKYQANDKPHPLESVVLEIFKARQVLDCVILAEGLKGDPYSATNLRTNPKGPKLGMSGNRAYLVVAEDVLGYMHSQGKVEIDDMGWYHLAREMAEAQ
jgi:hypothetical protein